MTQMQAIFIENQQLALRECAKPMPQDGEVRIKVAYAGLNRADIFQREGSYPAPEGMPNIPGLEVSGTIDALGEGVSKWRIGDEVCALLSGGGYAEYTIAKADHCLKLPTGMGLKEAAALPECAATVKMALWHEAQLKPGESVLVHGGASGIGTTALQMLHATGCNVFCTVGSGEKAAICEALGAKAIRYKEEDFVSIVKEAGGVDIVLDMVGGDYIDRNLQCLKQEGRLVSLALLQGGQAKVNAGRLLLKRLRWIGTTLRARDDDYKAQLMSEMQQLVWPWIQQEAFQPVIDSVFPLHEAVGAQEKMQKYLHCGKILLEVSGN